MKNCYECRFSIEAREHHRQGEQVRCLKAEELFGKARKGKPRWVDVKRSEKTGKLLKSKCGTFEPFIGDSSRAPDLPDPKKGKLFKVCTNCKGSGAIKVIVDKVELLNCHYCGGKGKVEIK